MARLAMLRRRDGHGAPPGDGRGGPPGDGRATGAYRHRRRVGPDRRGCAACRRCAFRRGAFGSRGGFGFSVRPCWAGSCGFPSVCSTWSKSRGGSPDPGRRCALSRRECVGALRLSASARRQRANIRPRAFAPRGAITAPASTPRAFPRWSSEATCAGRRTWRCLRPSGFLPAS